MNRADRAKQFLPFDAMKGLSEALRDREEKHSRVARRELSEESKAALSSLLSTLTAGDSVELIFYHQGHYLKRDGTILEISELHHRLMLDAVNIPIRFEDIFSMKRK